MNFYEELNNVQIVYAHKTLAKLFMYGVFNKPKRTELPYISEKDLDPILNKDKLFAYLAFAEACRNMSITDIDYVYIKKLEVYVDGSKWNFKYAIYNVPIKLDKISDNLSEPDIIKDRKLSGRKVHITWPKGDNLQQNSKLELYWNSLRKKNSLAS